MKRTVILILVCFCFVNTNILAQWINISPPGLDTTNFSVHTVNANLVYLTKGNHGTVLRSTNGGLNWTMVPNPSLQSINKVYFIDINTGYLAGNTALYKTTNAGSTWATLLNTDGFCDISFLDANTGFLLSINSPAKVYRTTNGGANFSSVTLLQYPSYFGASLSVKGPNTLFVLTFLPSADSSIVFKCTNWDSAWVPVYQTKPICYDISFSDVNTGVICGNMGALKRTSNGGQNWVNVNPGNNIIFQSVQLVNASKGYLVGNSGTIFKTTNAGINWYLQNSQTTWYLNDVHVMTDDNSGYIVGDFGTILKTTNGGVTFIDPQHNPVPGHYSLEQNYPNPFNPATTIKFALPVSGNVTLKVFDVTGRLVAEIVNGNLQAGLHEINFNSAKLSSGTYFYKLETKGFTDIKKMVLIK